jgi:predicted aldo/keto reductase-like oxidoreductase
MTWEGLLKKRRYGKDNDHLSIIGFGGIIVMGEDQNDADRFVAEAMDRGVNYFDVAPTYGDAQEKLGNALKGRRNNIFLACKTEKRSAKEAEQALWSSLEMLHTEYIDLYQMHGVGSMDDVRLIMGPGGCLEAFRKAKEKGIVRHIGFSAHSEEAALSLLDCREFESVLFPLNCVNFHTSGFGIKILEKATEKGITRLALKAMAYTCWAEGEVKKYPKCWYKPIDDPELAKLAVRYTLSKDISAAIPPGHMELFRIAADAAEAFIPLNQGEEEMLRIRSGEISPIF